MRLPHPYRETLMWRQGDILISTVGAIPTGATRRGDVVIAEGEATGHRHRVENPATAELLEYRGALYLRVLADKAKVIHEEHGPIALPRGMYLVWQQREYAPESIRPVRD
jgi:hypothetical protein